MSYVVGYSPDRGGADALAVARMMALAGDVSLKVCVVVPETWGYPSPAAVDAEYKVFLDRYARKALTKARAFLGDRVSAEYIATSAPSAAKGLSTIANDSDAELTIVGSARDGKKLRCVLGSTASAVLASTKFPTILAPLGYSARPPEKMTRVTCAYSDDCAGSATLDVAISLARRHQVPLRLVTFVVRDKQMYPSNVGMQAENMVANTWRTQAVAAQETAMAALPADITATATIGDGQDWKRAIAGVTWLPGEVLVAGAHHEQGVWSFLFGSAFTRLLRYASVPIVAVG